MNAPRIAPIDANTSSEPLATLFSRVAAHYGAPPSLGQRLIANHPELYRRWLAMGSELLTAGSLPSDIREAAILRVAHNTGCSYEWRSHRIAALEAGLIAEALDGWSSNPPPGPEFSLRQRLAINLADALHQMADVDDRLWDALNDEFEIAEIIELIFLIGHYTTTAYALNTLRASWAASS